MDREKDSRKLNMNYLGEIVYGGETVGWEKGVVTNGMIFLSGVDGIDPTSGKCAPDVETQTRIAFEKIRHRLEEAGSEVDRIVKQVTYIVGRENLIGYRRGRAGWLEDNFPKSPPVSRHASTLVLVAGLAVPEMLVEIDIIAAAPKSNR
jgi:2-iminobutanoate/2-iminopropanoate deaminase